MMGSRVDPAYRGKGVWADFRWYCYQDSWDRYPQASSVLWGAALSEAYILARERGAYNAMQGSKERIFVSIFISIILSV